VRLHGVVVLDGRGEAQVHPVGRGGERRVGVALGPGHGRHPERLLDRLGVGQLSLELDAGRLLGVVDAHQGGGVLRRLKGLGHHHGHRLPLVEHLVGVEIGHAGAGHHRAEVEQARPGGRGLEPRGVEVGDHGDDPGVGHRRRRVDPGDPAPGDGGVDENPVGHVG